MRIDGKSKRGCFKIVALFLVALLLCPNFVWASGRYKLLSEYDEKRQLCSFDDYHEMKERLKEIIQTFEKIEPASDVPSEENDDKVKSPESNGNKYGIVYRANKTEKAILFTITNENTANTLTLILKTETPATDEVITEGSGGEEITPQEEVTTGQKITPEEDTTSVGEVSSTGETSSEEVGSDSSEAAAAEEGITLIIKSESKEKEEEMEEQEEIYGMYLTLFDSGSSEPVEFGENREMEGSSPDEIIDFIDKILEELYGFLDDDWDPFATDDDASSSVKISVVNTDASEPYMDKSDRYTPVRAEIAILLKAYRSAIKKYYNDAQPYYSKLASELKKAQWLWREQGIDPHLYYAGADGVLDYRELRQMVEESIAYLNGMVPADLDEAADRDGILALEKDLRRQYIDPSFALYKDELKEASRVFYAAVEKTLHPLGSPYVNELGGDIEIIINLPRTSQ